MLARPFGRLRNPNQLTVFLEQQHDRDFCLRASARKQERPAETGRFLNFSLRAGANLD